jgi:hypothetical protein
MLDCVSEANLIIAKLALPVATTISEQDYHSVDINQAEVRPTPHCSRCAIFIFDPVIMYHR